MGLFVNYENTKQATKQAMPSYVNGNNCNYSNVNFGEMLALSTPSLFMCALNLFGDDDSVDEGKGKSKDDVNKPTTDNDAEISKQIEAKTNELNAVFAKAEVANISQLTQRITDLNAKVSGENSSANIQAQIDIKQNDLECDPDNQDIQSAIDSLTQQKKDAIDTENKIIELTALKGQAENIQNEILQLKNQAIDKDIKYDVQKETSDIKIFMTALKDFQSNPTDKTKAQAVVDAFKNGDAVNGAKGVEQASVAEAYRMIKPQLKALGVNPD